MIPTYEELNIGDKLVIQITGHINNYLAEVVQKAGCKRGVPYLQVINEDGTLDESWKDFKLKDGDYIIIGRKE